MLWKTSVALFASEQKRAHTLILTLVVSGTFLKRTERRDLQQIVGTFFASLVFPFLRSTFHANVYSYKQWRTERLNRKFSVRYKQFPNLMVRGSPQMKTTCTWSQNESELSQLLSDSCFSSTSYTLIFF